MFITQAQEILDACPTAKLDSRAAEKLVRSIEEEEETMLEPLLGQSLMDALAKDYIRLNNKYHGISPSALNKQEGGNAVSDDDLPTVRLIRLIQGALVYRMLANKLYSLSTSFNLGGGASRASASDYEPADDKHLQELRREYYMNSRRACDNILVALERDAKGEHPLWLDLWRESDGFYIKEDLLFPTLRSLRPFIPCEQPTAFIGLCPDIRYCQDTYITPRVGADTMDSLLDVTATLDDRQKRLRKYLRSALAYYVLAKKAAKEAKAEMLQTADSAMSTALTYMDKAFPAEDDSKPAPADKPCDCCAEDCGCEFTTFSTLMPGLDRW